MEIKIALAGNPNCGKTTLFNALTGSSQFVGNWPGVTVEKKEGKLKKDYAGGSGGDVIITDLPGIYSLSPYTLEEVVARNYLISDKPDVVLNIVDGTNIERNLYLSTQLMELGIPVVMAVNMMDIVEKSGDRIHSNKLSKKLGCEVVEISALKGAGIREAAQKAVATATMKKVTPPVHKFAPEVESVIGEVEEKLENGIPEEQRRFFAIKMLEKDEKIHIKMRRAPDVTRQIEKLEEKLDDDTQSIIANERYNSFLVFNLLCAPCFAAMGAIKREMNNAKWFWFAIGYQTGLAYVVSLCIYQAAALAVTGAFGFWTAIAFLLIVGFVCLLVRRGPRDRVFCVGKKSLAGAR